MKKDDQKNLIRTGAFVFFLASVLIGVVTTIGRESSFFSGKAHLKASTKNAQGLRPGSSVQCSGIKIGKISDISVKSLTQIEIDFSIDLKYQEWIRKDSLISINTEGLVGDKYLEILPGGEASPMAMEGDILNQKVEFELKQFIGKGDQITTSLANTLKKVEMLLTKIDEGAHIQSSLSNIDKTTHNFDIISQRVDGISQSISPKDLKLILSNLSETSQEFTKTSTRINRLLDRIETGPGNLHSIIYDDDLYAKVNALLGGVNKNKVLKYFIRESIKRDDK